MLLLHQPPRSARVYDDLMRALQQLGGIHVHAFDLPGFGNSCGLPAGTTMLSIAHVLAEGIAALGWRKMHVFGLHSGNKIAAALAAEHAASVDRLILAGMTHSIILDAEARNQAMQDYVRRKLPTDPVRFPKACRDEQIDRLMATGYDALYAANFAFDLAAAFARITSPTLLVELAVPSEEHLGRQAGLICARMRDARPLQIDFDDRTLLLEHADLLAEKLHRFCLKGDIEP